MFSKKISVQICTYNRKKLLEKVIESLLSQTFSRDLYEIVVVDDGSTDGTSGLLNALDIPVNFRYIQQGKLGLAIARNKGIREAEGEYILFLDDDVLADSRLLEEHVRFHESHSDSIVKGWVNHISTPEIPVRPRWTWRDFSTAFFWTSNVSVARSRLFEAGLFDEDFREYGWEDLELGLRLKKLGLKSRYHRKAVGYHYKRKVTGLDFPGILRQAEAKGRTALLFVQKQPGWRARLSTGAYSLRLLLDSFFSRPGLLKFYRRFISESADPLSRWGNFCAKALITARYFATIRNHFRSTGQSSSVGRNLPL